MDVQTAMNFELSIQIMSRFLLKCGALTVTPSVHKYMAYEFIETSKITKFDQIYRNGISTTTILSKYTMTRHVMMDLLKLI